MHEWSVLCWASNGVYSLYCEASLNKVTTTIQQNSCHTIKELVKKFLRLCLAVSRFASPEPPGQPPVALTEASFTDFRESTLGETEPRLCWSDDNCIFQYLRVTLHRESTDSQQTSPTAIRRKGSCSKRSENSFISSHSPSWSTTQPRITYVRHTVCTNFHLVNICLAFRAQG